MTTRDYYEAFVDAEQSYEEYMEIFQTQCQTAVQPPATGLDRDR